MNIVVSIKLVPDLIEELNIDENGCALDTTYLTMKLNEFDEHAVEQAILLKERNGCQVTITAPEVEGVDEALFLAAAKGAERLIKIDGQFPENTNNHTLARAFTHVIEELKPDLILTGVGAHDDMDGSLGPLMAALLDLPYVGYISGVELRENDILVRKEYPGGLIGEISITPPAVLGIQAADEPPRYVAVSKIRQVMKTASIEKYEMAKIDVVDGVKVTRMFQQESTKKATMLEGGIDEIAAKLVEIFKEADVL